MRRNHYKSQEQAFYSAIAKYFLRVQVLQLAFLAMFAIGGVRAFNYFILNPINLPSTQDNVLPKFFN